MKNNPVSCVITGTSVLFLLASIACSLPRIALMLCARGEEEAVQTVCGKGIEGAAPQSGLRAPFRSVNAALEFYYLWGPRLQAPKSLNIADVDELVRLQTSGGGSAAAGGSGRERVQVLVLDIGRCLDVVPEMDRRLLGATFGLPAGHRRERFVDGRAVYVDEETEEVVADRYSVGKVTDERGNSRVDLVPVGRGSAGSAGGGAGGANSAGSAAGGKAGKVGKGRKGAGAADVASASTALASTSSAFPAGSAGSRYLDIATSDNRRGRRPVQSSFRSIAKALGWYEGSGEERRPDAKKVQRIVSRARKAAGLEMVRMGLVEG